MSDGAGWSPAGTTKAVRGTVADPVTHTCTRPHAEAAGLHRIIPNVRSHGSTAFLYPGHAGGTSTGGRAPSAVLFLCSPPSCSAFFSERHATATLRYLILGFLILSYFCVLSSKSSGYKKLFYLLFVFLDAGSHLPGALSIPPRHGKTMFPTPTYT